MFPPEHRRRAIQAPACSKQVIYEFFEISISRQSTVHHFVFHGLKSILSYFTALHRRFFRQ